MSSDDLFPTTRATWLLQQLSDAGVPTLSDGTAHQGLREAREHVMRRYYEPLSAYLSATSYRDVDAPSALVAGFFVDRLGDDSYLVAWKGSGLPLRKWLVNGLLFWVRTEARRRRRTREREASWPTGPGEDAPAGTSDGRPEAIFEREWARSIVHDACELVAERLAAERALDRWQLFRRHVLDGLSYDEVARESACESRDVRNACRVVRGRLEAALIELLRAEGVGEREIEAEVARIAAYFVVQDEG